MTIDEVIKHFGSKEYAAAKLDRSVRSVEMWMKEKKIPYWSQLAIQGYTKGKLKADKG